MLDHLDFLVFTVEKSMDRLKRVLVVNFDSHAQVKIALRNATYNFQASHELLICVIMTITAVDEPSLDG